MWVVKHIFSEIISKIFSLYYKTFRYAGILFLLLIIECVALMCYRDDEIGIANLQSGEIVITDVEINDNYEFELSLENHGSEDEAIFSIDTQNQNGDYIENEIEILYEGLEKWGGVSDSICVPAGTTVKIKGVLKPDFLSLSETEKVVFMLDRLDKNRLLYRPPK